MSRKFHVYVLALAAAAALMMQPALAQTVDDALAAIRNDAKVADPSFKGFSAARGESFFKSRHGSDWSCSTCHTDNPAASGKHANTDKAIRPLAPSANAERFTDQGKVAKWFKRNCNDVLDRACTAQEKGDVLAYLLTVKK